MNRSESQRLQSEGNLGNERNRSSSDNESGYGSESMRNRSSEGSMRHRRRRDERSSSSEEWSPSSDTPDSNTRSGGSER